MEEKRAIIKTVKQGKLKGQFRFVLQAANGEIICDARETYTQKHNAVGVVEDHFPDFVIYEQSSPLAPLKKIGNVPPQERDY